LLQHPFLCPCDTLFSLRHAQLHHHFHFSFGFGLVEFTINQPLVTRHNGTRRRTLRVIKVIEMPAVCIFSAYAQQIRTCALASPKERMVIDKLTCFGIFTSITLCLTAERPYHL